MTKKTVLALAVMMLFSISSFASPTIAFLGVGSSAMFQTFGLAAYFSTTCAGNGGTGGYIWTQSSGAEGVDNRGGGAPVQVGNVWITWDNSTAPTVICAYLSVDSVVGNQLFFAQPTSTIIVLSPANTPGGDLVAGLTDTNLPQTIINDLDSAAFNAAMTDIRPEDALFATNRALGTLDTVHYNGLGYGPGPVGTPILSTFSSKSATPVSFALTGTDPITGEKAKVWTTTPVGGEPVIVFVNTAYSSGTGADFSNPVFNNVNRRDLTLTLNGTYGYTRDIAATTGLAAEAMNVVLREPTSGTYNTMEFCIPRNVETGSTQELGVNPGGAGGNPLDLTNPGGGWRKRAIGTGEMVKQVGISSGANGDAIGYAFWSVGNFANVTASTKYLTLDGVDPIFPSYSGGTFPPPCPSYPVGCPGEVSFTNVYNGSYPAWSILRVATVSSVPPGVSAMIAGAQAQAAGLFPDFAVFANMGVFRSHYSQKNTKCAKGVANGFISGVPECGGDVGGAVFTIQADLDYYADTSKELLSFKQ